MLGSEAFVEAIAKRLTKRTGERLKRASQIQEVMRVTAEGVVREVEKYFEVKREELKCRKQRLRSPGM